MSKKANDNPLHTNSANLARIPLPGPETMSPEQRAVFDAIIAGPRGVLVGPLRAALHNPELASRWQKLGEILRYRTSLPQRLNELAIVVTARRWNSNLEWAVHAEAARQAGVPETVIDAINAGAPPAFDDERDAEVYAFARELQIWGRVRDATYAAIRARWRDRGVVELTAVIGYYTMVSMTLNAHRIPLPAEMTSDLIADGGTDIRLQDIPERRASIDSEE